MKKRVHALVDGFNLYHAIHNLRIQGDNNHLKWVNLRMLIEHYVPASDFSLQAVKYFSAFATWKPDQHRRHRIFVAANQAVGVDVVMGRFKEKDRRCLRCNHSWVAHEEKETDVNIAIHALMGAFKDEYDMLLLVSADSDLSPAVRMVRAETGKTIRLVFPIGLRRSNELIDAAGGGNATREMKMIHLGRSLLPRDVRDASGAIVAVRPREYDPPASAPGAPGTAL
jgi:NYN domain